MLLLSVAYPQKGGIVFNYFIVLKSPAGFLYVLRGYSLALAVQSLAAFNLEKLHSLTLTNKIRKHPSYCVV